MHSRLRFGAAKNVCEKLVRGDNDGDLTEQVHSDRAQAAMLERLQKCLVVYSVRANSESASSNGCVRDSCEALRFDCALTLR